MNDNIISFLIGLMVGINLMYIYDKKDKKLKIDLDLMYPINIKIVPNTPPSSPKSNEIKYDNYIDIT